ncbi:MAG: hypothetical protein ACHREM_23635, partial [Polyangiales bacterium]
MSRAPGRSLRVLLARAVACAVLVGPLASSSVANALPHHRVTALGSTAPKASAAHAPASAHPVAAH